MLIPLIDRPFQAEITLPGSKSIALRQLAISALCEGTTALSGIPICDDALAMIDCLRALGADVELEGTQARVRGPIDLTRDVRLSARMSGASTRFLIGIAALRSGRTHIDGHPALRARTNAPLLDVLRSHGVQVEAPAHGGLPLELKGPLKGPETLSIDGSISSQYISALMLIAPLLGDTRIEIEGDLVSRPYLDITINEMAKRGIAPRWQGESVLQIPGDTYTPGSTAIEGDATAASYFAALASVHAGEVVLTNLGNGSVQGDLGFMDVMRRLGADVDAGADTTRISGPAALTDLPSIDMLTMPDAALTLIAMAPLLPGPIEITGLSTLHHKECDRLECASTELQAMGVAVNTEYDQIIISPSAPQDLAPHTLSTYHDHRMAMAFSVIGSVTGRLRVDDPAVVDKTYPTYWEDYARLRD